MNGNQLTSFSQQDIEAFQPTMKIGLLATVNREGRPHLTLLSSLQASSPTQVIFGQFTEGLSKEYIRDNPRCAFLIMTMAKEVWRGQVRFTHTANQGAEFDMYNNTPMFRYNSYFGVHTVYYMDLVEHTGRQLLPMNSVVWAAVKTMVAKTLGRPKNDGIVMNPWTQALMNKLDNLKFLAYVGQDGYPVIVPLIQAQAAGSQHVLFAVSAYRDELEAIPAGVPAAFFAMSLQMEDVLVSGRFLGIRRRGGIRCGCIEVDWVYNSMPPKPQQIFPETSVRAVTNF
ncbi:MAG: pyridoxamine 5'-phosphate oxidase family protein [Anaerolineales bacterium]|nr:pyridoxamine 5'-phosphate oxidase family protein [Anaerolineales bacterium]